MKTNTRVRRNHAAASSAEQVKTQSQKPPGGAGSAGIVTLVGQYPDGREFTRFDLPADIYALIVTECRKLAITLDEFIERAVRNTFERRASDLARGKGGAR